MTSPIYLTPNVTRAGNRLWINKVPYIEPSSTSPTVRKPNPNARQVPPKSKANPLLRRPK